MSYDALKTPIDYIVQPAFIQDDLFVRIDQKLELVRVIILNLFIHVKVFRCPNDLPPHTADPPIAIKNGPFTEAFIKVHQLVDINIHSPT